MLSNTTSKRIIFTCFLSHPATWDFFHSYVHAVSWNISIVSVSSIFSIGVLYRYTPPLGCRWDLEDDRCYRARMPETMKYESNSTSGTILCNFEGIIQIATLVETFFFFFNFLLMLKELNLLQDCTCTFLCLKSFWLL